MKQTMKDDLYSSTYSTLRRMIKIHQRLLSGGQYPNSQKLAKENNDVSTKTIQRDVKFMKEHWDLPISFNKSMGGYEYTEEVMDFPAIKLTEDEVFAFLIARNSIERYEGTHLHEPLTRLIGKIIAQMGIKDSHRMKRVQEYVAFRPTGWSRGKYKILDDLSKACRDTRKVSFDYDYPWKEKERKKNVKPLRVVNHNNAWYLLVANDQNKPGHFHYLGRISKLQLHAATFEEIPFSLEKHMKHNFGIFRGEQTHEVKAVFDAYAAPYVKERKWNDSQRIKDRKDGGIDFSIKVNHLIEIKGWILNWGKHARVIGPKELIDDLLGELKATQKQYEKR